MGDRQYYFSIKVQRGEFLVKYVITSGGVLPLFLVYFRSLQNYRFFKKWNREISS